MKAKATFKPYPSQRNLEMQIEKETTIQTTNLNTVMSTKPLKSKLTKNISSQRLEVIERPDSGNSRQSKASHNVMPSIRRNFDGDIHQSSEMSVDTDSNQKQHSLRQFLNKIDSEVPLETKNKQMECKRKYSVKNSISAIQTRTQTLQPQATVSS